MVNWRNNIYTHTDDALMETSATDNDLLIYNLRGFGGLCFIILSRAKNTNKVELGEFRYCIIVYIFIILYI